jgi:hypothetical protein
LAHMLWMASSARRPEAASWAGAAVKPLAASKMSRRYLYCWACSTGCPWKTQVCWAGLAARPPAPPELNTTTLVLARLAAHVPVSTELSQGVQLELQGCWVAAEQHHVVGVHQHADRRVQHRRHLALPGGTRGPLLA